MARLTCRLLLAPLVALAALTAGAPRAWAHPIHTTLSLLSTDASGQVVTIRIRAFADDFSAMVARFAGHPVPADSSAPPLDVAHYVQDVFSVFDESGKPIALVPCGVERLRELYWVCMRAVIRGGTHRARVRNLMLTELHADQINIVQMEQRGARKTLLFTKNASPASLP